MSANKEKHYTILEGYFYACCPSCKSTLVQAKNGLDGIIKCGQCGRYIHIVVTHDSVHTKQKESLDAGENKSS